jgi:hypothetical protein
MSPAISAAIEVRESVSADQAAIQTLYPAAFAGEDLRSRRAGHGAASAARTFARVCNAWQSRRLADTEMPLAGKPTVPPPWLRPALWAA